MVIINSKGQFLWKLLTLRDGLKIQRKLKIVSTKHSKNCSNILIKDQMRQETRNVNLRKLKIPWILRGFKDSFNRCVIIKVE